MLKKTLTYTDYDNNVRTEDFYFNLTKAELTEMELSFDGGLSKTLQKVIAAQESSKIVAIFKDLVLKSYGVKSPDGKRFMKSQEIRDSFAQTEAYSDLFMSLATNAAAAAAFVNAIVPNTPNAPGPAKGPHNQ